MKKKKSNSLFWWIFGGLYVIGYFIIYGIYALSRPYKKF